MPRIFGLRSCLQEVQDSIFLAGHEEPAPGSQQPPMASKKNWMGIPEPSLGSALDVINIPDGMDDINSEVQQADSGSDLENDENEPPVMPSTPNQVISITDYDQEMTKDEEEDSSKSSASPQLPQMPKNGGKSFKVRNYQDIKAPQYPTKNKRRRSNKHPGLRQVLSPKALYPSAPPKKVEAKMPVMISSSSNGGSSSSSPTVSNSGSGGSASGSSGSSRMSSRKSAAGGGSTNNNNNGELDLENLEYPDSPTSHKWFADNSDLSPLTVLDNINLKTEFPYSTSQADLDKPPDINSITLDTGAEHLFQFAASVPNVPDNTTTFLDIGADTFSQSLYDDLGDINMNDFPNVGAFATASSVGAEVTTVTVGNDGTNAFTIPTTTLATVTLPVPTITTPTSGLVLAKPITLERIEAVAAANDPMTSVNIGDLVRLKGHQKSEENHFNNHIQVTTTDHGVSVLKGLIEPLPASALKGLIKVEPVGTQPTTYKCIPGFIKVEQLDNSTAGCSDPDQPASCNMEQMNPVFSPLSLGSSSMASPGSPNSTSPGLNNNSSSVMAIGGGKIKASPVRKKSTSSNTTDEDDISNIPSLQTRIQIISQRLGIPPDAPIELINGGHGIKNPLSVDPEAKPVPTEKLPPARPESDPSKFQCRLCSKIFTLQRLLNRHMKCHSDTKRYLCTFCGKGFNDTFDLKRHTRTHTGVRPYKCNLCEKSFTQRCSLESHCLKVHGVAHQYDYKQRRSKMYVCEDCGHTTPEPEVHYLHLKDNHPFSPALHKFYDKRHFKFTNANFASMLLQVNS